VYQKVPLKQRGALLGAPARDFQELSEQPALRRTGRARGASEGVVPSGASPVGPVRGGDDQSIDAQEAGEGTAASDEELLKEGRDSTAKRASTFCKELASALNPALWTFTKVEGNRADQQPRRTDASAGGDVAEAEPWARTRWRAAGLSNGR